MQQTDWSLTSRFSPNEWPSGVAEALDLRLMHELFRLRESVPSSHFMTPSPIFGAHIRNEGNSRHSTKMGTRQSDATDLFMPNWKVAFAIWNRAIQMNFGGIGLYTDTQLGGKKMPMIHLDMRDDRLMWVRDAVYGYVYFQNDPKTFFKILAQQ